MHHNTLPFGNHAIKVPPRGLGTDLASLLIQFARHISGDWKRIWWEESEFAWPLARAQSFDLRAELIRFLLHTRKLLIHRLALLKFAGKRARDLKLPRFATGFVGECVPVIEG
jgi:hypothetical protein